MSTKQSVLRGMRRLHLLNLADRIRFLNSLWRMRAVNRAFRVQHPEVRLPPSYLAYEAYGAVDWPRYLGEGRDYAAFFAALIDRHVEGDGVQVLDWGCGPGRVIRHMPELLGHRRVEIHGSDYNPASIDWCRRNLPSISFRKNRLEPPLEYADRSFDAVYSMSVFTHLSEAMHEAWRDELVRVLRPGGVLIVTLHGDFYRSKLLPDEQARYDAGHLVSRGQVREGKRLFAAFHSPAYVRGRLLAGLQVLEHITELGTLALRQDVWVARRPATAGGVEFVHQPVER